MTEKTRCNVGEVTSIPGETVNLLPTQVPSLHHMFLCFSFNSMKEKDRKCSRVAIKKSRGGDFFSLRTGWKQSRKQTDLELLSKSSYQENSNFRTQEVAEWPDMILNAFSASWALLSRELVATAGPPTPSAVAPGLLLHSFLSTHHSKANPSLRTQCSLWGYQPHVQFWDNVESGRAAQQPYSKHRKRKFRFHKSLKANSIGRAWI